MNEVNRMIRFLQTFIIMIISVCFTCCGNDGKETLDRITDSTDPTIQANQEKALNILEKLIVAEKRFAVKKGYYADLDLLREKGFFTIQDSEIDNSGYNIRLEYNGVKFLKIYMNPIEYKKTGVISFFADETSKIRGGDHGGKDASERDPEIFD